MKLIIAGGRDINVSSEFIVDACRTLKVGDHLEVTGTSDIEVVSGRADGIDTCGEEFATEYSCKLKKFPADWDTYGKGAGHIRNKQMADYSDGLLLIWNGESKGSANMREQMLKQNKPVYEVILRRVK
jgi:hypothetical protein